VRGLRPRSVDSYLSMGRALASADASRVQASPPPCPTGLEARNRRQERWRYMHVLSRSEGVRHETSVSELSREAPCDLYSRCHHTCL
jgi:hypothetical protein